MTAIDTTPSVDFADVYTGHLDRVWRFVRARVPDHHEAHDVTSDVFVRAWRSWDRFDPDRGAVEPWLYTIAHRSVADWWRRRRPEPVGDDDAEPLVDRLHDPEAEALRGELLRQLGEGLAALSDREREGLALRFAARLSMAHVAEVLGTSVGAAKMMLHRAVRRLAEETDAARPAAQGQEADLEGVIDEVLERGHAVLSQSELHGLLVHLAAVMDEPVPDDLPRDVAHCVRCAAEEDGEVDPPAGGPDGAGRGRAAGAMALLLALSGVCLVCTVPALAALLGTVAAGAAAYAIHYVGLAAAPLVAWVVYRGVRRHRMTRGFRWARAGVVLLGLHGVSHVAFTIMGFDTVVDTLGIAGEVAFDLTDWGGTGLLAVGAFLNLLDMQRWRAAQGAQLRAVVSGSG